MDCWKILGIAPTDEEQKIKEAYYKHLEHHHPEEDPEGFIELRNAYEEALKNRGKADKKPPRSPEIQAWVDRVEAVYENFEDRLKPDKWEELLTDPACVNLETEDKINEALLEYIMDHFHMPHQVFEKLAAFFDWEGKKEALYELFPENFIDYAIERSQYGDLLRYERFKPEADACYDEFISCFFELRQAINDEEEEDARRYMKQMEAAGIPHPDFEVQKIRYNLFIEKDFEKAWEIARDLEKAADLELMDIFWIIRAGMAAGKLEDIAPYMDTIMKQDGENPQVLKLAGDYQYSLNQLGQAAKLYEKARDLSEERDERIEEAIVRVYKKLAGMYLEEVEEAGWENARDELLWKLAEACYMGTEYEKLKEALTHIHDKEKDPFHYLFWMAEGLHFTKHYEEAIPYRKKVLELMDGGMELPEPELKQADLGIEYAALGNYKQAIESYDKGLLVKPESMAIAYQKAKALYLDNQMEEADKYCEEVLHQSFSTSIFYVKVKALLAMREYERLTEVVERLISQGFDDSDVFYCYAIALRRLERYEDAREYLGILKERWGEDGSVMLETARLEYDEDHYEEALKQVTAYIEQNPESEGGLYLKADILRAMDRDDEAISIYEGQVQKGRADETDYYRLGGLYYRKDQLEESKEAYLKALDLYPEYYSAMNELGDVYQSLGCFEEAVAYYRKALGRKTVPGRWYLDLARILRRMKRYEEAIEVGLKGIEENPDYRFLYSNVALLHWDLKKYEEAIPYYEKYGEFEGKKAYALGEIGDCYAKMNQYDKAEEYYEKSVEEAPEDAMGYKSYGLYYLNTRENYEMAVWYLLKALEKDETDSYVTFCIGSAYEKAGKEEDSQNYFRKTLEIAQKDLEEEEDACNYESLADAYAHLGELDKAIEMAHKALDFSSECFTCPGFPCYEAYEDMARAYERAGRLEEALACIKKAEEIKSRDKHLKIIERLEKQLMEKEN